MTSLRYSPAREDACLPGLRPAWAPDLAAGDLQLGFGFPPCPCADLEITIHLAVLYRSITQQITREKARVTRAEELWQVFSGAPSHE
jgi:hypothetical protein